MSGDPIALPMGGTMPRPPGGLRHGVCAVTGGEASCTAASSGSWKLRSGASSYQRAMRRCLAKCAACSRCRWVSFSPHWRDCSWFETCGAPSDAVQGFLTLPANATAMQQAQSQAYGHRNSCFNRRLTF